MLPTLRHWLHARRHPDRYAQLEYLLRNQALSREQVLEKQRRDLAAIVAHAHHTVPYYRERFAYLDGAAFHELPILSKDAVASRLDDLLSSDADRAQAKLGHTGGSTGKPLAFWYDAAKHELMRAGMMRGFMMSGWRPGQKVMYFWGARHDTRKGGVFGGKYGGGWGANWGDLIAAEKTITAVEYSEAKQHEWARAIQTWRPTLLYGYASAMSELARHILANRLPMPKSLIGVYSTAEMLDDSQREVMQEAFGCKVFNQYGCREVPNIAWECRHGHMHVFADLVHLESVEIEGEARFLVTSLSNRQMPFIRYDVGDSGRLLEGDCPCGSPFPQMEMGMCRKNDLIRTRAGATFHPAYFNRLLYGMTQIRQYQWVQTALDRLDLNLVTAEPLSAEAVASLRASLARDVDPAMRLEVHHVDEIPRTVSGKHRFMIGLK
jgi:phenylacetate-CoA ligase